MKTEYIYDQETNCTIIINCLSHAATTERIEVRRFSPFHQKQVKLKEQINETTVWDSKSNSARMYFHEQHPEVTVKHYRDNKSESMSAKTQTHLVTIDVVIECNVTLDTVTQT